MRSLECESFQRARRANAAYGRTLETAAPQERRHESLGRCLAGNDAIVAATDYVRAYPHLIAPYLSAPLPRSAPTASAACNRHELRRFFEVDREAMAVTALHQLARRGLI